MKQEGRRALSRREILQRLRSLEYEVEAIRERTLAERADVGDWFRISSMRLGALSHVKHSGFGTQGAAGPIEHGLRLAPVDPVTSAGVSVIELEGGGIAFYCFKPAGSGYTAALLANATAILFRERFAAGRPTAATISDFAEEIDDRFSEFGRPADSIRGGVGLITPEGRLSYLSARGPTLYALNQADGSCSRVEFGDSLPWGAITAMMGSLFEPRQAQEYEIEPGDVLFFLEGLTDLSERQIMEIAGTFPVGSPAEDAPSKLRELAEELLAASLARRIEHRKAWEVLPFDPLLRADRRGTFSAEHALATKAISLIEKNGDCPASDSGFVTFVKRGEALPEPAYHSDGYAFLLRYAGK
jgi:hypothetical protein